MASRFAGVAFQGFSAEMTRQVEISTLSAHQIAPAGVVAHFQLMDAGGL